MRFVVKFLFQGSPSSKWLAIIVCAEGLGESVKLQVLDQVGEVTSMSEAHGDFSVHRNRVRCPVLNSVLQAQHN